MHHKSPSLSGSAQTAKYAATRTFSVQSNRRVGVQWGYSHGYDEFGNLADKIATKGSAQTDYLSVNSATNQVRASGDIGYDANGNWYGMQGSMNIWNMENQLVSNGSVDGGGNPGTRVRLV